MSERRRQLSTFQRQGENFARSRAGAWYFINVAMRIDRVLLPLSRGRVSSAVGEQVGLLETTGAKSGERRRIPLLYLRDGNHVVLIASKGGNVKHPAWYWNLKANPGVRFLGPGGLTGDYVAREAEGDERARLWTAAVDYYDGFATYQGRTDGRRIPVVVLEPAALKQQQ
jgi:deazaflavin-dependent oxidoreductase (nitroreductase family)